MEEAFVSENSWIVNKEIKDLRLRDRIKVSVIGITEKKGRFIQMPKGTTVISADSKLLLVGSQRNIAKAKRMIALRNKPEDLD
jgi:voltage-gated potassium channel